MIRRKWTSKKKVPLDSLSITCMFSFRLPGACLYWGPRNSTRSPQPKVADFFGVVFVFCTKSCGELDDETYKYFMFLMEIGFRVQLFVVFNEIRQNWYVQRYILSNGLCFGCWKGAMKLNSACTRSSQFCGYFWQLWLQQVLDKAFFNPGCRSVPKPDDQ